MEQYTRIKITVESIVVEEGKIIDSREIGYGEFILESVKQSFANLISFIEESMKREFPFLR